MLRRSRNEAFSIRVAARFFVILRGDENVSTSSGLTNADLYHVTHLTLISSTRSKVSRLGDVPFVSLAFERIHLKGLRRQLLP